MYQANGTKDDTNVHKGLTERQQVILNLLEQNVHITRMTMSTKLGVNEKTIRRDFAVLGEQGLMTEDGIKKMPL